MKVLGNGYDVYVEGPLLNAARQKVGTHWTVRTNGHCQTDLEMAEALTHDLTKLGVRWEIRDRDGRVVKEGGVKWQTLGLIV